MLVWGDDATRLKTFWKGAGGRVATFQFLKHPMAEESTSAQPQVFESDLNTAPAVGFAHAGDDEVDEVIGEIPVYLSTNLAKYLYVFQYPMKNAPFTSSNGPMAARIKPNANMVELDLPLNTRSPYYSTDRGEEFAMGMNEKEIKTAYDKRMEEYEEEMSYGRVTKKEDELLDRLTLSSTEVPQQTRYAIGVLHEGKRKTCSSG